jgi:hypothetical protein
MFHRHEQALVVAAPGDTMIGRRSQWSKRSRAIPLSEWLVTKIAPLVVEEDEFISGSASTSSTRVSMRDGDGISEADRGK